MSSDVRLLRCAKHALLGLIGLSFHAGGQARHIEASPVSDRFSQMCLGDEGLDSCVERGTISGQATLGSVEDVASFLQTHATVGRHGAAMAKTTHYGPTVDVEEDGRSFVAMGQKKGPEVLPSRATPSNLAAATAAAAPAASSAATGARFSLPYAAFTGLETWSGTRMQLRAQSSLAAQICFLVVVLCLAAVLIFMVSEAYKTDPSDRKDQTREATEAVRTLSSLPSIPSKRSSPANVEREFSEDSGVLLHYTRPAHTSPDAGSSVLQPSLPSASSQRTPTSARSPAAVSLHPGSGNSEGLSRTRLPSQIKATGSTSLRIPLIIHDEIPIGGKTFAVTDLGGGEELVVKAWPANSFKGTASGIPQHSDACEILQVFLPSGIPLMGGGGGLKELFLCVICGSGSKFACYVYREGVKYGTIAADLTFPTAEYVVGSPYTLKASDNRRLMTILRSEAHGMQILSGQAKILADVKERMQDDLYECMCQAGADPGSVVLMVLGMDRLDDHISRNS